MSSDSTPTYITLTEEKRQLVLSLLAAGCSRRTATHFANVSASTITRAIARDNQFALAVFNAESQSHTRLVRAVQSAADNPRYWRAAAWLLERRCPHDFAPAQPDLITPEVFEMAIQRLAAATREQLGDECARRFGEMAAAILFEMRQRTLLEHATRDARDLDDVVFRSTVAKLERQMVSDEL